MAIQFSWALNQSERIIRSLFPNTPLTFKSSSEKSALSVGEEEEVEEKEEEEEEEDDDDDGEESDWYSFSLSISESEELYEGMFMLGCEVIALRVDCFVRHVSSFWISLFKLLEDSE